MTRRFWSLLTLTLLTGTIVTTRADETRPNILVVLSDDHSSAHLGCYGNKDIQTPNIDRFATQAMRFERYYVTTPQCVPSRASLMTGRAPVDIQMSRFSAPLPSEYKVYPQVLREQAGYFAGVAGRSFHLDGAAVNPASRRIFQEHDLQTFPKRLDYVKSAGNRAEVLNQYREFLDAVPKGKPFVLQLCFSDPHRPLDRDAIPRPHDPSKLTLPPFYPDTALVREDFARYYDEISRFDGDVGTVLAELDTRGLADNTIMVVSGDNGASQFRGKGTLYEFGIHVPLLVRWPGKTRPGSSTSNLISGEDLAPTLLDAAGLSVPPEMTGKSFAKTLKGEAASARRYVFAQRGAHGSGLPTSTVLFDLIRGVVSPQYKLVYNVLWQLPYSPVDFSGDAMWKEVQQLHADGKLDTKLSAIYFPPTRPMFELFDLKADPHEMTNLIGRPEVAKVETELKEALQEWMILQRDFVPLPLPPEPRNPAPARRAGTR